MLNRVVQFLDLLQTDMVLLFFPLGDPPLPNVLVFVPDNDLLSQSVDLSIHRGVLTNVRRVGLQLTAVDLLTGLRFK